VDRGTEEAPSTLSRLRDKLPGLVATLVVGFVGGLLLYDPFVGFACGHMSPAVAANVTFYCHDEDRPVATTTATREIDRFLERASGPRPLSAWSELGPDAREARPKEEFREGWSDVYWAERLGPVSKDEGFNQFHVRYRVFRGSNPTQIQEVDYRERAFEISYQNGRTYVAGLDPLVDLSVRQPRIVVTSLVRRTAAEALPALGSRNVRQLPSGQRVAILCKLQMQDGRWGRLPAGWVRDDVVRGGMETMAPATDCDGHHRTLVGALLHGN
jgi:hypothetical protein